MHFAVAQDGDTKIISSRKNLPSEQFTGNASLLEDGSRSLKIDGNGVAKVKTKGLFNTTFTPENIRLGTVA